MSGKKDGDKSGVVGWRNIVAAKFSVESGEGDVGCWAWSFRLHFSVGAVVTGTTDFAREHAMHASPSIMDPTTYERYVEVVRCIAVLLSSTKRGVDDARRRFSTVQ